MPRSYQSIGKPNIYRKSNTLYFRMVVPKDIVESFVQREVYKSLQTSNLRLAEEKATVLRTSLKTKLGFGRKHVFNSFRNTVITQLVNAGIQQNLINDIIGHEQTTMAFGVYDGDLSLAKRLEAIKALSYMGLDTSPK